MFGSISNKFYECVDNDDVEAKSDSLYYCRSIMRGNKEFNERLDEWMNSVQIDTIADSEGNPNVINPKSSFITVDNLSQE